MEISKLFLLLFVLQLKEDPGFDALLSDICIGTSAAPTYLPAHYFETKDHTGKVKEFNLIDGGVAANNPVSAPSLTRCPLVWDPHLIVFLPVLLRFRHW